MTRKGRPLRFLVLVVGGWVTMRVIMLWPQPPAPVIAAAPTVHPGKQPRKGGPPIAAQHAQAETVPMAYLVPAISPALSVVPPSSPLAHGERSNAPPPPRMDQADPVALAKQNSVAAPVPQAGGEARPLPFTLPMINQLSDHRPDRLSGSFWLIARDGRGVAASLSGGQLGGSQAGVRLALAIGTARRVAIVGRLASPLDISGQEGAIGIEWRPTPLPVRLVAEQRIGINGAAGGPSLGIIGGVGPLPIGRGLRIESYGQAGIIGRDQLIGYAEGAASISLQVARIGRHPVQLGAGGWGAVQPGAARLDLGPSIAAHLPLGEKRVRLTLDWRQRVAGPSRPGSGPALSIGTDF